MRNYRIDFDNFVRRWLPEHKRRPVRMDLLRAFVRPLKGLFDSFEEWRDDTRRLINLTGQVAVMEGYLNEKYNTSGIRIETFTDGAAGIALESEGAPSLDVIDAGDAGQAAGIPLEGESAGQFDDCDFIVRIPEDVPADRVIADIERFRVASKTYKIQ